MMQLSRARRSAAMLATGVALVLGASPAQAQVNFDNLPPGNFANVPAGYAGYNWFYGDGAFGSGNALQYSSLGGACHSASNCAYNASANTVIRIETLASNSTPVTFSAWLASGYPGFNSPTSNVLVQGFVGTSNVAAYSLSFALPGDGSYAFINLAGQTAVNKILITPRNANNTGPDGYVRLDDVTLTASTATTTAPEPGTVLLVAAGLGAMLLGRGRVRRTA